MILASDALRLPCAQLTENDREIVDKLLREIEEGIRTRMRRNGFDFQTNNTNPAAMFEVVCVLQDHGFAVNCQLLAQPPRLQGGQPTHVGYALSVVPTKEAIEASKRDLQ